MTFLLKTLLASLEHPEDCLIWPGAETKRGYGLVWDKGKRLAHRLARQLSGLSYEEGLAFAPICGNPLCVNPHHWEELDGPKCKRGHNRIGDNMSDRGQCCACTRMKYKEWISKRRGDQ